MARAIAHFAVGARLTTLLGAVAVAAFVLVTAVAEHRSYRSPRAVDAAAPVRAD